jgi:hypothetical protein
MMADFHLPTSLLLSHFHTTIVVASILFIIHAPLGVSSLSFDLDFSTSDHASHINYTNDSYWAKHVIQLTTKNDSIGRVWYARPVQLWDPSTRELASFNTNFSFQIKLNLSDNGDFRGDGMAFFLSHYPSVTPDKSGGSNLGLLSRGRTGSSYAGATGDEKFVAVEFDTWQDKFENSSDHVGIDINAVVSQASKDTAGVGRNLSSGVPMTARVRYHNDTTLLSVDLQIGDAAYHVSKHVDLRDCLPPVVAVGFSAATRLCGELHELLSWSFNSTDLEAPAYPQKPETTKGLSPERLVLVVVSGVLCTMVFMVAAFTFKKIFQWCKRSVSLSQFCGPKRYQYHEAASESLRSESNDRRQMERVLVVGLKCTEHARGERPSKAEALRVLENPDSQLPSVLPPLQAPTVIETPSHQDPNLEMALVPSRMYSNTASVATSVKRTYSSGTFTDAGAWSNTQPSSTGYSTFSIGRAAPAESLGNSCCLP